MADSDANASMSLKIALMSQHAVVTSKNSRELTIENHPRYPKGALGYIIEEGFDGVIFHATSKPEAQLALNISRAGIPLVILKRYSGGAFAKNNEISTKGWKEICEQGIPILEKVPLMYLSRIGELDSKVIDELVGAMNLINN